VARAARDEARLGARGLFVETLAETLRARRASPLALVGGALLSAEWIASGSWLAVAVDLALLVRVVLFAPWLWRWLCASSEHDPSDDRASRGVGRGALGWLGFVLVAALLVGVVLAVPPLVSGGWTYVGDPNAFGLLVALFVVGGWGLGRDIELERGVLAERARAERLAALAEHAQLLALRAQLDPHFLFNTLNAIAEWCRQDAAVAERATLQLASLLRRLFDALQRPTWRLSDELALIEELTALYATRDAERYRFAIEVQVDAPIELPPLLVLPLVENAIKHGPAAGHDGVVTIAVVRDEDVLTVTVENPGAFRGRREGGTGLPTLERRLALAWGERATSRIAAEGERTRATLVVPVDG
jgi:signal transduction histidine kinase